MSQTTLTHDQARQRYELKAGDEVLAYSQYNEVGAALMFTHTETLPAHEGQGLGSRLVQQMLDDVRAHQRTVIPMCPFVTAFISKHPEYLDLVPEEQRRVFGL
jgi:uncharacterized protein